MGRFKVSLNSRQRSILFHLLKERHTTMSALAELTNLTPRIVRYNMDKVELWLHYQGVRLLSRPGYGLHVDATQTERNRLLNTITKLENCDIILRPEQRQRALLLELLLTNELFTYQELADDQGISRSTAIDDLSTIEQILAVYRLQLKRRTNKGIWIEGSELSRRFAILYLLKEELTVKKWYQLWTRGELGQFIDKTIPANVEDYIQRLELPFCHRLVQHIEANVGLTLSLRSRVSLKLYLAITIDALKENRCLESVTPTVLEGALAYEVAQIFVAEIANRYRLPVSNGEAEALAAQLLSSKWTEPSLDRLDQCNIIETRAEAKKVAEMYISVCANHLHPLLNVDEMLHSELTSHFQRCLHQLRYGIPIRNTSLDAVRERYGEVYRGAELGIAEVEAQLDLTIPPDEIGYLTMYLAAALERLRVSRDRALSVMIVGDGSRAKLALLRARLDYEFPHFRLADVLTNVDFDTRSIANVDLIISMADLDDQPIPVVQVSPFLAESEVAEIRDWLTKREIQYHESTSVKGEKPTLVNLLPPEHIALRPNAADWQEVVRLACNPLVESQHVTERYVEAVTDLIETYGPISTLAPGVLLLHAGPTDGVNKLSFSLLLLEEGVSFGAIDGVEQQPYDIVFVMGAVDHQSHLDALFQLNSLVENPHFLNELRDVKDAAEVFRVIWLYMPITSDI